MPPPTPGMVQRPKFAGLKSRTQAPFQTVDLGGTPTSSRASDATASPLTQPPPKAAAAGGPAAEEAANATPTPTTAGASPQPPASVPATATGSSTGRNVQFAAPASPTTVATPSTAQTPSSTDYAAQFGSKLPPGGFVAAPCGRSRRCTWCCACAAASESVEAPCDTASSKSNPASKWRPPVR